MNKKQFTMKVCGTVEGELYWEGHGTRQFSRPLGPVCSDKALAWILKDELSRDFSDATIADGWLEVTYHKANGRRVQRDFDLRDLPSVAQYMTE